MLTQQQLSQHLRDLYSDDGAFGIAHRLKALGIKGYPKVPTCCPIANYIKTVVEPTDLVKVHADTIYVIDRANGEIRLFNSLPYYVRRFIQDFDHGYFPDLEETNADQTGTTVAP